LLDNLSGRVVSFAWFLAIQFQPVTVNFPTRAVILHPNLSIKAWTEDEVLVLQLVGSLDMYSSTCFREIEKLLDKKGTAAVFLDMSNVSEMDAAGAQYLVNFGEKVKRLGGAIRLYRLDSEMRRLLRASGGYHSIKSVPSRRRGLKEIRDESNPERLIPRGKGDELVGALYSVIYPPDKPLATKSVVSKDWLNLGESPGLHINTTVGNRQYYFFTYIAWHNESEVTIFRTEPQVPVIPGQVVFAESHTPQGVIRFRSEVTGLDYLELTEGIKIPLIKIAYPETVIQKQNRYYYRAQTQIALRFKDLDPKGTGRTYDGIIRDLSGGGCLITCRRDFPRFTFILMEFRLPDGSHIRDIIGRVTNQTLPDVGDLLLRVQFVKFDPADRDRILQLVWDSQVEDQRTFI